jgi:hypothetical protein
MYGMTESLSDYFERGNRAEHEQHRQTIERMAVLDLYSVIRFAPTPLHELSAGDLAHLVFDAIERGSVRGIRLEDGQ